MDFAPVLDINSNHNNKVIGDRSFSSNKNIVANLGVSEINGFKSSNIISVAKHFPGHGDTDIDSHYKLPIINKTLDELKEVEFVPFKNAIEENVPSIMVSHILFPEIDDINPASMSKTIITDILRKDLKFDGLIVTDDMTMVAITNNFDISEACIKSINAGADLLLICHGYETEVDVINNIKDEAKMFILRDFEVAKQIAMLRYTQKEQSAKFIKELNRFNITQNNSFLTTQWDNFYKHIDLSFDNFYTLLKDNFSDLNEKELQLCCMMVAGFKTEEIAAIWMQSIFSVHKYKTNIRKKLKTPEGANIIAFLMSAPPFQ